MADKPAVLGQPAVGIRTGARMRSTTIGRIGTSFSRTVWVGAMSIAVCSNGDKPRASTVSASAPIRSRRRAATVEAHCSSDSPLGRWPSSSGIQASVESVPRDDGASADGVRDGGVFALRVVGTYTRRPNGSDRV